MSMWKKAMAAAVALLLTAAASAEAYEGKTAAQRVHEVYAEGTAETICAEVGQTVSGGETLLTLRTQKVFATQVEVRHDGERRAHLLAGVKPRQKALRRGLLELDEPGHQP